MTLIFGCLSMKTQKEDMMYSGYINSTQHNNKLKMNYFGFTNDISNGQWRQQVLTGLLDKGEAHYYNIRGGKFK